MNDTVGKEGAERAFENYLRGSSGVRALERNTSGKVVSETWLTDPKPGNNVVLTIDLDLQGTVEDVLANSIPKLASKEVQGAACVILDVNNGDVLASASYPTFSLAAYGQDIAKNGSDPLSPLFNRALLGTSPPGSTFKMVTAIARTGGGHHHPLHQDPRQGSLHLLPRYAPQMLDLPPARHHPRPGECERGHQGLLQLLLLRCGPPPGHWTGWWTTPPASAWERRQASS